MTNHIINPAVFFVKCWKLASTWSASVVANVQRPGESFRQEVRAALSLSDGKLSFEKLESLVEDHLEGKKRGRILVAMEEMDGFFYQIHPRALYDTGSNHLALDKSHWLKQLQAKRILKGCYCRVGNRRLIPRGPLTREFRPIHAANADCFRDRFSALSVVSDETSVHEVPVKISIKVRVPSSPQGVPAEGVYRDKTVAFMPIAEKECDLSVVQRTKEDISFVNFKASSSLDVAKKALDILSRIGAVDIVMAPELVVSEGDSKAIGVGIRKNVGRFRAFVAGSGHTVEMEDEQSWNKSSMFNGAGGVIFDQRKIWLSDIPKYRAEEFGLDVTSSKLMEDNASADELVVADLEGFGRCVILICQDLNATPLAEFVIGNYQPDWVFIPVLDVGLNIGRWFHRRILELSELAPSRFLVCSSLSLAHKASYNDAACGLAFGPLCSQGSEEDVGREQENSTEGVQVKASLERDDPKRVTLVKVDMNNTHGYGLVSWSDAWYSTRIVVEK